MVCAGGAAGSVGCCNAGPGRRGLACLPSRAQETTEGQSVRRCGPRATAPPVTRAPRHRGPLARGPRSIRQVGFRHLKSCARLAAPKISDMLRTRHRLHLLTWALWGALVLAALAPGMAHALTALRGDSLPWAVVCTAEAERANASQLQAALVHPLAHCPFCQLHADALALPPAAAPAPTLQRLSGTVPRLFLQAPHRLRAWAQRPAHGAGRPLPAARTQPDPRADGRLGRARCQPAQQAQR